MKYFSKIDNIFKKKILSDQLLIPFLLTPFPVEKPSLLCEKA
jgi:hypothetical protein